ncbi:MAG: hypothetical protein IT159_03655 [Bryobacterales bacterium]|nr:hypothetical protein [Bryobacterales bacterium]
MSKYGQRPMDFARLKTIPIRDRGGKVRAGDFGATYAKGSGVAGLVASLPRILAADALRDLVDAIAAARAASKPVIWGLGGHVIKCGLAPVLIGLMQRGFATAFAMNGAASIHDFEIAIAGATSEDVEAVLPDGSFGSAEETGREMNLAVVEGHRASIGMGEALGRCLDRIADPRFAGASLLLAAWKNSTPVTVHVAMGTDTPHTHPQADGAAIGAAGHRDFRLFCSLVAELDQGGVYINAGSAVVLPEVFLKAVSVVRNLGHPLAKFTTANLDFLQHYRPRVNVVERPHAQAGGRGIAITGHHEILIPLLAAALIEGLP